MQTLILFGLAGLLGQLVTGTLGMGFGVTATTTLVALGTTPAVASASVHFAQTGTALASGISHWKFENVDWRTVGILAAPGAIGAALGAYFLTSLATGTATVWITGLLLVLGLYVLIRFSFLKIGQLISNKRPGVRFLGPLGLIAGFVDATGGGGWGPLGTSTLLSSGRLEPRKVVGSVTTSEFVVSLAASVGFLFALSSQEGPNYTVVLGLLVGGVIAAPFAAWLVRKMPPRVLGAAAGGLIVLTNARTLLEAAGAGTTLIVAAHIMLATLWALGLASAIRSVREERRINALAGEDDIDDETRRAPVRP